MTEPEKPRQKPETPVKPDHLLNHVPTWPLKNRLGSTKNDMKGTPDKHLSNGNGSRHSSVLENNSPTSFDVMDEVNLILKCIKVKIYQRS